MIEELQRSSEYVYRDARTSDAHQYLIPTLLEILNAEAMVSVSRERRLFDLGCGNGSVAAELGKEGWTVFGVDASTQGIAEARRAYPKIRLEQASAYDDLAAIYGQFPIVVSLEVVEHVYAPRKYAKTLFDLVQPGGLAVVSTPYHGYMKNIAIALLGKMDSHFTALWDDGHIKFWSIKTLSQLLNEVGFCQICFHRVGRIPMFAKSMIATVRRPA